MSEVLSFWYLIGAAGSQPAGGGLFGAKPATGSLFGSTTGEIASLVSGVV